ncbi:unnamed protein product [Cuscuta campestris]|uniref:Large ribosomal subunit protein uL15/eL18 domain-containing protein n=1 Tax=Cuscuta campestris TaxID=132261 RepID=A0A484LDH7_9ASTE|nr:unnamed protein product [Cuscuta campestris]
MATLLPLSLRITSTPGFTGYPNLCSSFKGYTRTLKANPCQFPCVRLRKIKPYSRTTFTVFNLAPESAKTDAPRFRLNNLGPQPGSTKNRKRKGRGHAAGQGGSCGFGMRGQKSRSGPGVRKGFEGGQMPLYRRLPKLKGIAGVIGPKWPTCRQLRVRLDRTTLNLVFFIAFLLYIRVCAFVLNNWYRSLGHTHRSASTANPSDSRVSADTSEDHRDSHLWAVRKTLLFSLLLQFSRSVLVVCLNLFSRVLWSDLGYSEEMMSEDGKIRIEKFDGQDFGWWKMQVEDLLCQKDLLPCLTGMRAGLPKYVPVNLKDIEAAGFHEGEVVSLESLSEKGIINPSGREKRLPLKILGDGELGVKLTLKARAFSASAKQKLEAAGCSLTVLPGRKKWVKPSVAKNLARAEEYFAKKRAAALSADSSPSSV